MNVVAVHLRRISYVLSVVALASAGVVATTVGSAGAEPVTTELEYTGATEDFVVPAGVCSLTVDVFGAQGGTGASGESDVDNGGLGGRATATISVTPGETLTVTVGGAGDPGAAGLDAGFPIGGAPGGFPDGGDGGGASSEFINAGGGAGGGSSSVSRGGTPLVVAGGGGGGGAFSFSGLGVGGAGGGTSGDPGTDGSSAGGGAGGTPDVGGSGGVGSNFAADAPGTDGASFQGGAGGGADSTNGGGGGGGGGLFGGGGGGGVAFNQGEAGGGGGGSGFGPAGVAYEAGARAGDGVVILSYDPALPTCPIVLEPRFTG